MECPRGGNEEVMAFINMCKHHFKRAYAAASQDQEQERRKVRISCQRGSKGVLVMPGLPSVGRGKPRHGGASTPGFESLGSCDDGSSCVVCGHIQSCAGRPMPMIVCQR